MGQRFACSRGLFQGLAVLALLSAAVWGQDTCGPVQGPAPSNNDPTPPFSFNYLAPTGSNCKYPTYFQVYFSFGYYVVLIVDPCEGIQYRQAFPTTSELLAFTNSVCNPADQSRAPQGTGTPMPLSRAAGTVSATGQASQIMAVGDFNGDGGLDEAVLTRAGVVINLMSTGLTVGSSRTIAVPFATGGNTPPYNHVISRDFNADGKLDLAVSNTAGGTGSNPGGVALLRGNGDGTFQPAQVYAAGNYPLGLTAGDFNGDGKLDIVALHSKDANFSLLPGRGDGTFGTPTAHATGSPVNPAAVLALDLNADGRLDLVIANNEQTGARRYSISVVLNSASGWRPPNVVPLTVNPTDMGFADLNHDGAPDIVVTSQDTNAIAVLRGKPDGSFETPSYHVTGILPGRVGFIPLADGRTLLTTFDLSNNKPWFTVVSPQGVPGAPVLKTLASIPSDVAATDLNGDGQPDAVIGSSGVLVSLSNGGVFADPASYAFPGAFSTAVATADLNSDGKQDVIAVGEGGGGAFLGVFLGNGDGTLQAVRTRLLNYNTARSIATADFNRDGKMDVALADYRASGSLPYAGNVAVLLGNGDGTLSAPIAVTVTGFHPRAVSTGDFNADGNPDLAVSLLNNASPNSPGIVAVLLGKGDGTFDPARTFPMQAGRITGGAGVVTGDWNGDGKTDVAALSGANTGFVELYLGDGTGGLQVIPRAPTLNYPNVLRVADVNADGKLDLLLGFSYLAGRGDGTFPAEYQLLTGRGPYGLAVTNFNGKTGFLSTSFGGSVNYMVALSLPDVPAPGQIRTPAPGATLSGTGVTFSWNAVPGATRYRLEIGSSPGGNNLFTSETQATSLTVTGLPADGRTLYVKISAFSGGAFAVTATATYAAYRAVPLRFVPITPCRVMETRAPYNFEGRSGAFGPPTLTAGEVRTLNLPQSNVCAIPATAKAYVVNMTAIPNGGGLSYATVWPAGDAQPNVWTIRSPDGQIVANSAIVQAGTNGGISVFTSDRADLIIDISGYYTDSTAVPGLSYYPLTPCRVIDTRLQYRPPGGNYGPPSMTARQTRRFRFPATTYCNVPLASAYSVTLTVVPPAALAYLTAWPGSGVPQPNVSSINSFAGRVLANSLIIPASADGSIDIFAFDTTDFIVDINGYFAPDNGNGLFYFPVRQCRASDSTGNPYADESVRTIQIPLASGCSSIPTTARGYAINVTALPNANPMPFLTAYPTGSARPNASLLNAFQGQVVTNSAILPAGTNGAIDIFAFRRTDVVVEVSGYFGR